MMVMFSRAEQEALGGPLVKLACSLLLSVSDFYFFFFEVTYEPCNCVFRVIWSQSYTMLMNNPKVWMNQVFYAAQYVKKENVWHLNQFSSRESTFCHLTDLTDCQRLSQKSFMGLFLEKILL